MRDVIFPHEHHHHRRRGRSHGTFQKKENRNAEKRAGSEADKLPLGQVEKDLRLHRREVLRYGYTIISSQPPGITTGWLFYVLNDLSGDYSRCP